MSTEVHVNDIGTVFRITVLEDNTPVDLSEASEVSIVFASPRKTASLKSGVFATDGTDGVIEYVTKEGDLYMPGTWNVQAQIVSEAGTWSSSVSSFTVLANIFKKVFDT